MHLAPRFHFTHIFSSDLKRAYKTAFAVQSGQKEQYGKSAGIQQLKILQEQDFGSYERKAFGARGKSNAKAAVSGHGDKKPGDLKDAETKASMAARADRFLDDYVLPVVRETMMDREQEVAIVSHGMILSTLWKCLLKRFALHSVSVRPGVDLRTDDVTNLEHLGAWSNTGYLELNIQSQLSYGKATVITEILAAESSVAKDSQNTVVRPVTVLYDWRMSIRAVNCRDHLQALKRTGGGVGSSKHDETQKNIDTFFKKRRIN